MLISAESGGLSILSSLVVDCDFKGEGLSSSHYKAVNTFNDGEAILRAPNIVLSSICVNPAFLRPSGIQFIKLAHELRPATPIYIVQTNQPHFSESEMHRLGLSGTISRTELGSKVMEYQEQMRSTLGLAGLLEENYWDSNFEDKVVEGYKPIRCADFISGQKCLYDVHVKLESGRFLKILSANDCFSPERVSTYIKKGVRHFYVNESSLRRCIHYCESFSKALLLRGNVSYELKISEMLGDGVEVVNLVRGENVNDQTVESIADYLAKVRVLIFQSAKSPQELIKVLESRLQLYEHSVGVAMIAGLLTKPLQIESETAFRSVGTASFLHDIGLFKLAPELANENVNAFTAAQLAEFQTHPDKGAKYLEENTKLDASVIQAVAQHHERRDGSGFPRKLGAGKISPIAEIVGISDEFVRLLREQESSSQKRSIKEIYDLMEIQVFNRFSFPVVEAFRSVFMNKPKA
jgi:HD-GYP domain-containing protein (c-di-GMP phosphodiesterase class II)